MAQTAQDKEIAALGPLPCVAARSRDRGAALSGAVYQIFMVVRPRRSLELLLQTAQRHSAMGATAAGHPDGAPPPISAPAPERQLGR
jgi:hypothetical protein